MDQLFLNLVTSQIKFLKQKESKNTVQSLRSCRKVYMSAIDATSRSQK